MIDSQLAGLRFYKVYLKTSALIAVSTRITSTQSPEQEQRNA